MSATPPPTPDPIEGLGRPETYGTIWTYGNRRSWRRRLRGLFSGPRRVREGALSAERTPTNPPEPTRRVPLVGHGGGASSTSGRDGAPPPPPPPPGGVGIPETQGGGRKLGSAIDPDEWGACEAKRLRLGPDDVVVVRHGAATYVSTATLEQLGDQAKTAFPGNRVVFLVGDMDAERLPCTPAAAEAIGKAAAAGCAMQGRKPERIYVLASSQEHAQSFALDWASAREGRRPTDCVDVLAKPTMTLGRGPQKGDAVVRLAAAAGRQRFEEWSWYLRQRGVEVRDVEEVAACAL